MKYLYAAVVLFAAIIYIVVHHHKSAVVQKPATSKNLDEWLLQSVPVFRSLGFFKENAELSDADLGRLIADKYQKQWGHPLNPSDPLADLFFTQYDTQRVWWKDAEADVCEPNNVYVETWKEWAAISRGAFSPSDITERWQSEKGPVSVKFPHQGKSTAINPEFLDDYIDLTVLLALNRAIASSGVQFHLYRAFDQTAFVVALKPDEKSRLIKERRWRFAN